MDEKIILNFSGWCECNPDKVRFQYIGPEEDASDSISGTEWLALPEYNETQRVRCRDDYMLESTVDAQATALDGDYDFWSLDVEEQ